MDTSSFTLDVDFAAMRPISLSRTDSPLYNWCRKHGYDLSIVEERKWERILYDEALAWVGDRFISLCIGTTLALQGESKKSEYDAVSMQHITNTAMACIPGIRNLLSALHKARTGQDVVPSEHACGTAFEGLVG
jgi:hypothetical protein